MSGTKGGKGVYVAALLLLLGGAGWLVFSGVSEKSVYFVNVSEALGMDPAKLTQAKLFGAVAAADLALSPDGLGVGFTLQDKDDPAKGVRVNYRGAVPDTFKPGAEVIVEGAFGRDRSFAATTLITKCPSKYEKVREEERKARPRAS